MNTDNNEKSDLDLLHLSDLSQKDRIQILLSEYSALRSEILSRTGFGFQLAAIATAVITYMLKETLQWYTIMFFAFSFGVAIFVNIRDLTRAAYRVKELELEINSRAGEHLLIWETLSGLMTRAKLIKSFFNRMDSLPRSELPPLNSSFLQKNTTNGIDAGNK